MCCCHSEARGRRRRRRKNEAEAEGRRCDEARAMGREMAGRKANAQKVLEVATFLQRAKHLKYNHRFYLLPEVHDPVHVEALVYGEFHR